jgi:hypothetical protein
MELASHVPVRDLPTLADHHRGLTGQALAEDLITNAARASAACGAAAGALAGAEELAPPAWIALPAELVAETLGVVAIEFKLVAELHEAFGHPIAGAPSDRAFAIARAWAEQRGITSATRRSTRNLIVRRVRRRLVRRLGRNLSSWIPLFIGAAAGAVVNQRATRALGESIAKDLATR